MLDLTSCGSPAFRKDSRAWLAYNGECRVQVFRLQERKMAVRGKEGMRLEGRKGMSETFWTPDNVDYLARVSSPARTTPCNI